MVKRFLSLSIVAAFTLALAAAAIVSERASAQCTNAFGASVPCSGDKQKRPTPTASKVPTATAISGGAAAAPAADCTPSASGGGTLCSTLPLTGVGQAPNLGVRPPNPNLPFPGSLLSGTGAWGAILLIILILVILLAIAIPTFLGARDSANAHSTRNDGLLIKPGNAVTPKRRPMDELSADDFIDTGKPGD